MSFISAMIVAAGSSRRAGFDKLMAEIDGICVLRRSLNVFLHCSLIREIIVVCPESRFQEAIPDLAHLQIPVIRVDGGTERHFSVWNGLKALSKESSLVAIHDGARPLLSQYQLIRCLDAATVCGASASARPIVDTLKRADTTGMTIPERIDRDGLWAMETPQVFDVSLIRRAYEKVISDGSLVTDEVSAMAGIDIPTQLITNDSPNPKITLSGDLEIANMLWRYQCHGGE
ncbi:MAG: IspD/TarI family cytidylyltransferase [Akkermansia sp.]